MGDVKRVSETNGVVFDIRRFLTYQYVLRARRPAASA